MENFTQLLLARESCRRYADRPVPREALIRLVEHACLAPSGCNAQPWRFLIVDEPEAKEMLVEALDDNGLTGCTWGAHVPAFIVICEDKAKLMPGVSERYGSQFFAQMDIGMAAMCLTLAAADAGLATCLIGTVHQGLIHEAFQIPYSYPVRLIVTVGYDAAPGAPRKKQRKPLSDVLSCNVW